MLDKINHGSESPSFRLQVPGVWGILVCELKQQRWEMIHTLKSLQGATCCPIHTLGNPLLPGHQMCELGSAPMLRSYSESQSGQRKEAPHCCSPISVRVAGVLTSL